MWAAGPTCASRFDGAPPAIPDDWTPTLRAATGRPDLTPEVLDVQRFTLAAEVATTFRAGPGFLVGDAAHRTTPVGGIGLNTAVHDGHELGWKLAWVARGLAGEELLASHDAERGPVGLEAAARSLDVEGRPTDGLASSLGHTHRSTVIAGSATAPDLRIDLAARPGERAPHAWVRHDGRQRSILDLFDGRLTLLTGADGEPWARAATVVTGVPLRVLVEGRDVHGRGLGPRYGLRAGSAVLVRPDGRVAWRHDGACADRAAAPDGRGGHGARPPHRRGRTRRLTTRPGFSTGAASPAGTATGSAAARRAWPRAPCAPRGPGAGPRCRRRPATCARRPRRAT